MSEEKISKALEIKYEPTDSPKEAIVDKKQLSQLKRERREQLLNTDFDSARDGIKELIGTGMDAVDGIMRVATAGDSPRAYEVAATLLKTLSEMNKDLLDLHTKANEADKDKVSIKNTTNNSIYVGSTTDLQNLLNKSRSQFKSGENLIDAEKLIKRFNFEDLKNNKEKQEYVILEIKIDNNIKLYNDPNFNNIGCYTYENINKNDIIIINK